MQQEIINQEMHQFRQDVYSQADIINLAQQFQQKNTKPLLDLNNNNVFQELKNYLLANYFVLMINCYKFDDLVFQYSTKKSKDIQITVKCCKCNKYRIFDFHNIKNGKSPKCCE